MVSEQPISPRLTTNMAIAGFLGLMMGTLLAFFVDYLQRVRESEELEKRETPEALEEPSNEQSNHETQNDGHRNRD